MKKKTISEILTYIFKAIFYLKKIEKKLKDEIKN